MTITNPISPHNGYGMYENIPDDLLLSDNTYI